jgi:GDPmannose 4,6-dehydratase
LKTAIITGITGQDGAYLSKFLLTKEYKIVGLTRKKNSDSFNNLKYLGIFESIIIEECDLTNLTQLIKLFNKYLPDEVYNLAAQSSVSFSFHQPIATIHFNIVSVLNLLEVIKMIYPKKKIRFYQASSSEMYGKVDALPITENTVFHPLSPYAISKASAHWITVNYRESYGIFACCGVLFNHESFLRSNTFFIKKIIRESLRISEELQEYLFVGNIDIKRDFGFAPQFVEAMWLMLQKDVPSDYLVCSGKSYTLRNIIEHVFNKLNIDISKIKIDTSLYRPIDIEDIYGNNSKAKLELNWNYNLDFMDAIDLILSEEKNNGTYKLY